MNFKRCAHISTKNFKNANPATKVVTLDGSNKTHSTNGRGRSSTTLPGLAHSWLYTRSKWSKSNIFNFFWVVLVYIWSTVLD